VLKHELFDAWPRLRKLLAEHPYPILQASSLACSSTPQRRHPERAMWRAWAMRKGQGEAAWHRRPRTQTTIRWKPLGERARLVLAELALLRRKPNCAAPRQAGTGDKSAPVHVSRLPAGGPSPPGTCV